jgi:hypothetical protein
LIRPKTTRGCGVRCRSLWNISREQTHRDEKRDEKRMKKGTFYFWDEKRDILLWDEKRDILLL